MFRPFAALFLLAGMLRAAPPATSAWVRPAADGRLLYQRDELGNRIPDFSACGYRNGRAAIPSAPVKATVQPGNTDDRVAIQAAIDQVSALPLDEQGLRGAVLLRAGEYRLDGGVTITASGVVLRGEDDAVLRALARRQHTLIAISGPKTRARQLGPARKISDPYVPVGACSFTVEDATDFHPGDRVIVHRPSTAEWIRALGMDQLTNPWKPGDRDCFWERVVTRLEDRRVFLDAPITTAIDAQFGSGRIWKIERPPRVENCGVENLRGISETDGTETDEQHGWIFVGLTHAENCWVRGVVSEHFGYACVAVTDDSRTISVLDSQALDPVSQITGGRRYGFYLDDVQLCLVKDCRTRNDRHQFVTGSNTSGPNAFVSSMSASARSDAGPHHRWASGVLFDALTLEGGDLNVQNRGNSGSGHGWAGANCVVWNCVARGFVVQNPPTAQNWLIGSIGTLSPGRGFVGPHHPGTVNSHGIRVTPDSLYAAQLADALKEPGLEVREYVAGDFDGFATDGNPAPVDPAWKDEQAKHRPTALFDASAARHVVPWTHTFRLDPDDKIVSATLHLCVRPVAPEALATAQLILGSGGNTRPLSQASSHHTTAPTTVLCFDLASELPLLGGGQLNAAVGDRVAVDWAVLELRVVPVR